MPHTLTRRTALLAAAAALPAGRALAQGDAHLQQVAAFPQQVTGVAVSATGRIFVNFPRWEQDVAVSVAELGPDGTLTPYPDAGWNAWRNATPLPVGEHFVCVQSVVAHGGALWVVDPAAPGNEFLLPGGPKLVRIDLAANKVARVYRFGPDVAPQGSYLNDVRFTPDGAHAVLTDSGQVGALLILDVASGTVRRRLSGHPSTQADKSLKVQADGHPLLRPDGRGPLFSADGLGVDPHGEFAYWQALSGRTMFRIPMKPLLDPHLSEAALGAHVERLGDGVVADGYWYSARGVLYVTSPEDNSVKRRLPDGTLATVVQDDRLRWPDSMAEGADGTLYVTASHIQDMAQWTTGKPPPTATALFRFSPA